MKLTTWIKLIVILVIAFIYNQSNALASLDMHDKDNMLLAAEQIELVNINTADVDTLSELPGLGPKKAEAIVAYRERNGEFRSIEELVNVKGIGEKLTARLLSLITV